MRSYKIAVLGLSLFAFASPAWGQLAPVVTPEEVSKQDDSPTPVTKSAKPSAPPTWPRGIPQHKSRPAVRLVKQPASQPPTPAAQAPIESPPQPPGLSVPRTEPPRPSALDSGALPTTTNPSIDPNQRTSPFASLAGRRGGRLFRTPPMFGDFTTQNVFVNTFVGFGQSDIPLAGGARRMKIGEQNRALPQDRVYFSYNHFRNAIDSQTTSGSSSASANRYTFGLEKAFRNNDWSCDVRFPLTSRFESNDPTFPVTGGEVGNLQMIVKKRLSCRRTFVTSAGLGFDVPTGSGVLLESTADNQRLSVANDALTIQPFFALQAAPNDLFFANGFLQCDVPVNGNEVAIQDTQTMDRTASDLDEVVLMHVDLSGGVWLYESTMATGFTGLAAIAEFHYATGLSDPETVIVSQNNTAAQLRSSDSRTDVPNVTVGLHAALGRASAFRIGGAFPLSREKRVFSSEFQASLILGY